MRTIAYLRFFIINLTRFFRDKSYDSMKRYQNMSISKRFWKHLRSCEDLPLTFNCHAEIVRKEIYTFYSGTKLEMLWLSLEISNRSFMEYDETAQEFMQLTFKDIVRYKKKLGSWNWIFSQKYSVLKSNSWITVTHYVIFH